MRRLILIERNRVLLAAKLFPARLLWLNGYYYARRLWAGIRAASAGEGETALFPGWRGKRDLVKALVLGDLQALWLLPRIWRKRSQIDRIRRLSPSETARLIQAHRISLEELAREAAIE